MRVLLALPNTSPVTGRSWVQRERGRGSRRKRERRGIEEKVIESGGNRNGENKTSTYRENESEVSIYVGGKSRRTT